ncbi:conserved hypothetical protein [Burkholderia pseudomallei 668]|nr:conserved hypothetical protein [Burkholderia pseudomallei 668]
MRAGRRSVGDRSAIAGRYSTCRAVRVESVAPIPADRIVHAPHRRDAFPVHFSRSLLRHASSIRSFDTLLQDASSARFVEALARSAPRAPIPSRGPPPNGAPAAPAASQPPSGPDRIAIGRDTR